MSFVFDPTLYGFSDVSDPRNNLAYDYFFHLPELDYNMVITYYHTNDGDTLWVIRDDEDECKSHSMIIKSIQDVYTFFSSVDFLLPIQIHRQQKLTNFLENDREN